ncbi:MAG TPA: hypothetical protein VGI18_09575 [Burkholderiales bacterium]
MPMPPLASSATLPVVISVVPPTMFLFVPRAISETLSSCVFVFHCVV